MKLSKNNRINGWAVLLQTRPSFFHGVKKPLCLDVMQRIENIQIYGWAALPNILCHGPTHFVALKSFCFGCYADFQQRSIERLVVFAQHDPADFTVLKEFVAWMVWSFPKTFKLKTGPCSTNTAHFFHSVNEVFRLDVMQPSKNIQVYSWATLPNIACHGPAHSAAFKKRLVLMLSRLSTKFKWTAGRAPPNTVQLISRCWKNSRLDGMKLSKNNRTDGRAVPPQTRPSFIHGVEEPFVLGLCS